MDAQSTPAIAVDQLVKRYKTATAVDGISFQLPAGSITGLLGGNGAGKTTTIAMIMGLVTPTSGTVRVLGAAMPDERYRVLHRMNFESPYVDLPMRLTVRQNLSVFAQLYAVPDIDGRIGRAEDTRVACQGAAQPARRAAARRADRLARSRHRRLGARPP
jgi:ABC-2 type transport system ATP-binding protein